MPSGWYYPLAALLVCLVLLLYFYKIDWVKDLRIEGNTRKILANYLESRKRKIGKLPPVYPNGWFALTESWKIRKGEVKHFAALGENFGVFRTENGELSILDAYCPHLGANMAEGGRVKGECLECPFHGWQFRASDGQCDSIPYAAKVPKIARVRKWESCEVNNLVFVWHHAEGAAPAWKPQAHEHVSSRNWRFQGRNEFLINCHIQEIAENGADVAHLEAVHGPFMFLQRGIPRLACHSWTNAAWRPHASFLSQKVAQETPDTESQAHRASMTLRHHMVLFSRLRLLELNVNIHQIGPGYVELLIDTALGPMCIFQTVTPLEPLLQRVTHTIYSPLYNGPYTSLVFLGECLMFERDVAVWNKKKFMDKPLLVKEDGTINVYRRWYSQFYSENSPTLRNTNKCSEW